MNNLAVVESNYINVCQLNSPAKTKHYISFLNKQASFLQTIKSNSPTRKYKRVLCSPIRYAGGKSLAVGIIIENIPSIKRLVSPFFGGGSVEIACAHHLGIEVIGYDIFNLLVNYWQQQLYSKNALYELLKTFQPTKTHYNEIKIKLKQHWEKEKLIRDPLTLAAYYYYNHNTSYGPNFLGWPSSIYMNVKRYLKILDKVKSFNGDNISVYNDTFTNVIPKYKYDFLYLDPPYYLKGDSKMFKGIYPQRNFPIHHNGFDHALLSKLLKAHKGGFILSYNDCNAIREWYKEFEIMEVAWQYTMGQGETRIGKNRMSNNTTHVKKSHELLIIKRR